MKSLPIWCAYSNESVDINLTMQGTIPKSSGGVTLTKRFHSTSKRSTCSKRPTGYSKLFVSTSHLTAHASGLIQVLAGKIEKPRKDFKELVAHVS